MSRTGVRLRAFIARYLDARTMELFVDPVLADLQSEHEAAACNGERWRARWIWLTGHTSLAKVLVWAGGRQVLRRLHAASVHESPYRRHAFGPAFAVALAIVTVLVAAMALPLARVDTPAAEIPVLLVLLMPQALPMALPIALAVGVLDWSRRRPVGVRGGAEVAGLVLACSLASFIILAHVAPDANQLFRQQVARLALGVTPAALPRGVNELTLGQLRTQLLASQDGNATADGGILARNYHRRFAMAAASPVFAIFALAAAARWRHRRRTMLLVAVAGITAYFFLLPGLGRALFATLPAVSAWTPNVALVLAVVAMSSKASPEPPRPPG